MMRRTSQGPPKDERGVALYRLFGWKDRLLYVGITNNPKARFEEHSQDKYWWDEVERYYIAWLPTREAALRAESEAIFLEHPIFNKSRPYTLNERRWLLLARAHPQLWELERRCIEAQERSENCLWPDVLHQLHDILDTAPRAGQTVLIDSIIGVLEQYETTWDQEPAPVENDLSFAVERLNALLPSECSCEACWEAMVG